MKLASRTRSLRTSPNFPKNPFMADPSMSNLPVTTKQQPAPKRGQVFEAATGSQIGNCDGFYRKTQVDATQHIKLYLEGIGALCKLSKPGLAAFQALYCQMLKQIEKDKVPMTPVIGKQLTGISQAVYFAGMTQLIDAGFIAKTDSPPFYWVNPKYIFNGNRLRFVQDYDLRNNANHDPDESGDEESELFLQVVTKNTLAHNRKVYEGENENA